MFWWIWGRARSHCRHLTCAPWSANHIRMQHGAHNLLENGVKLSEKLLPSLAFDKAYAKYFTSILEQRCFNFKLHGTVERTVVSTAILRCWSTLFQLYAADFTLYGTDSLQYNKHGQWSARSLVHASPLNAPLFRTRCGIRSLKWPRRGCMCSHSI